MHSKHLNLGAPNNNNQNMQRDNRTPPLNHVLTTLAFLLVALVTVNCSRSPDKSVQDQKIAIVHDSIYINSGNHTVARTFDTLRNSLLKIIGEKGFPDAISYCNERAYAITNTYADSMTVRRTALRYRNQENRPDSLESSVLKAMEEQMKTAATPGIKLVRNNSTGEIHFFKPIMLQPLCFNCHGVPEKQIQKTTLARIQELYPDDRAINFKEGDLRGVWHIVFKPHKDP
jgi:hypothetical protein